MFAHLLILFVYNISSTPSAPALKNSLAPPLVITAHVLKRWSGLNRAWVIITVNVWAGRVVVVRYPCH